MKNGDVIKALLVFEEVMLQSQIRGKHATGVSYISLDGRLKVTKAAVAVKTFLDSDLWTKVTKEKPTVMIGHARYSTSGGDCQPVAVSGMSLVHNGMISMATQKEFQKQFGVQTASDNDSEIILQKINQAYEGNEGEAEHGEFSENDAICRAFCELYKISTPIYACALLNAEGQIKVIRDHIRPLWFYYIKDWEIMGFASTEDIIKRALKNMKDVPEHAIWEADPYTIYTLGFAITKGSENILDSISRQTKLGVCFGVKPKFTAKPLVDRAWLNNGQATLRGTDLSLDSDSYADGDHRLNLRESFKRYCVASVKTNEIDPNYALLLYLFERYELSESQRYWACWLYGVFYHPATVFYVMQEFPEFELVDLHRLERWHTANWRMLRYNTDRKYEKGHFVEMFVSYRTIIGGQTPTSQKKFFESHFKGTPYENFHNLWKSLNKLERFGRYSLYYYTEALARCMGLPIEANTLFLKEADSPRAGLCYVVGKPDWCKAKLSHEDWSYLILEADKIIAEINREYTSIRMDYWWMESCLCAYKGFFRDTKGRYVGYYIDRMADEILQMSSEDITSGVEWTVLWQFRKESFPWEYLGEYSNPRRLKVQKNLEHQLRDTGHMVGLWPVVKRGTLPRTMVSK